MLPNAGEVASADAIRRVGLAAEELGLDSVWASEHMLVAADAAESYGRVFDSLTALAWLAAQTERVRLGTSIVLVPLHHPVELAHEAATLQELSGGRLRLGLGTGWHEEEFRFLGFGFADRGRRADEAIRLLRALWAGETAFSGRYWSFDDARFGPLPDPAPEIWIGGTSPRSLRRARELGDAWHPNDSDLELVRRARERWPEGPIVPRTSSKLLDGPPDEAASRIRALAEAGADGIVQSFGRDPDTAVAAMERFAREIVPRLA